MADIDDLFTDPNAGAYEIEEARAGPPLDYIGGKLRDALEFSHRLVRGMRDPHALPNDTGGLDIHALRRDAEATFRYALTSYLALYNMLGLISDHRKVDALLELDGDTLEEWLVRVQRQGSVSG
jgi:hypothetical protein